jgi:glutaredoxin
MAKVKSIKIYTTQACSYCNMEKDYLSSKGIIFEEILVDQDPKVAEEMIAKSGQMGVPFTEITFEDGSQEFILGFDKTRLDQVLDLTES